MRQAALLIIVGITMGLLGATWSTRCWPTMLFGLTPLDGATYGAVALTFATVAIVASYVTSTTRDARRSTCGADASNARVPVSACSYP